MRKNKNMKAVVFTIIVALAILDVLLNVVSLVIPGIGPASKTVAESIIEIISILMTAYLIFKK